MSTEPWLRSMERYAEIGFVYVEWKQGANEALCDAAHRTVADWYAHSPADRAAWAAARDARFEAPCMRAADRLNPRVLADPFAEAFGHGGYR